MSNTPKHSIRIPDWLWADTERKCARLDISVSYVVRLLLTWWTRDERK